ncbi:MAG TPA: hypothetical protein VE219_05095, partial [Candidatus Sulfotelmatobacter sp.]|nr:hypothetical protein [Candidatus Sulfotelmatobacter sp.]
SIIIYVAMMAAVLFFQRPAAARLATLAATNSASTGSRGIERAALMRRLKFGSMGITTAILIIAVLMIWRPGGTL